MTEEKKCPNCGQYRVERRSVLTYLIIAVGAAAFLVITLPLEILLIPALVVGACMPSVRAKFRHCRNCRWTDKPSGARTAA